MTNSEAIETLKANYPDPCYGSLREAVDTAIYALSAQPTIEPRKKGKWILGGYEDMYYICNCCQYKESEYYLKPKANFCPNCGADMRGKSDE